MRITRQAQRLIFALPFVASACVTANFKQPASDFQKTVDTASTTIGTYYAALNDFERDIYLQEIRDDKSKTVDASIAGKPTPLLGRTFSAESIRARVDAISLLGVFAHRLVDLAGSDAPQTFEIGAKTLGENLDQLAGTFNKLRGDTTAPTYAGPIGEVVGAIGRMALESKRDAALKAAINSGAPAVQRIVDLLEKDLVTVIQPLRETGEEEVLADKVREYNANRQQWSPDQRQTALQGIKDAAIRYEAAVAMNPTSLTGGLRGAMGALVQYANSNHKPQDLAQLNTALELFQTRAEVLATAVNALRKKES